MVVLKEGYLAIASGHSDGQEVFHDKRIPSLTWDPSIEFGDRFDDPDLGVERTIGSDLGR